MKKLMLLFLMIAFFMVGFASAEDFAQHKQGIDLPISVTSNNATSCILTTIQTPTSVYLFNDTMYEASPKNFNTTIKAGNFTDLGNYCFNIVCSDGVRHETGSVCKSVTPTGFTGTLGFYFLTLILSGGIIIFGFWKQDAPITILGSFGLFFLSLYILFNGIEGFKDPVYTWGIGLTILGLAMYISARSSYELVIN